jgi:formate-dependent nitrite reductase membrane component NrfD
MNEIDIARHSLLIDPRLHVWGWEIPVYLFLGGLAAGVMIWGALLRLRGGEGSPAGRWATLAAPILVTAGMGALFIDLGSKLHVWRFYAAFRWTSPMSWGAWILLAVVPASVALTLAGLDEAQAERFAAVAGRVGLDGLVRVARALGRERLRTLCTANVVLGVALGTYTGILLATLGARALWHSALLGPLFLVSGVSGAAALLLLLRLSEHERALLERWDRVAIAVEAALLLLLLADLATGGAAARAAAGLLLGGPFTAQFWSLVVIAGLGVPLALETLRRRLRLSPTVVAPLLVLAGGLALRWIVVAAGQA